MLYIVFGQTVNTAKQIFASLLFVLTKIEQCIKTLFYFTAFELYFIFVGFFFYMH